MSWADLDASLDYLLSQDSNPTPTVASPESGCSPIQPPTRFARRVQRVKDYFNDPSIRHIPINYVGEGAYDFVLSDWGLDLFAPPVPETGYALWRYYSFRRTGRPCIGLPIYATTGPLTFATDATTGAGQILTTNTDLANTQVQVPDCYLATLPCLNAVEVPGKPIEEGGPLRPTWRNYPHMEFSFESFLAAAGAVRCWQVEGSVYRAIITELPRVVADIWMEGATGAHAFSESYSQRFQPGNAKARELFMERIETSLPDAHHMLFDVVLGLQDVEVSNRGFRFPGVGAPGTVGPDWDSILNDIIAGRAGNPVFTDSKRPDGDE